MRPRDVLAENLKKLMAGRSDLDTFPKITKAGGGSNGTLDRIRRKTAALSVDNLAPLAHAYGLQPWQLLVDTLAVKDGAVVGLPQWPFERVAVDRYLDLDAPARAYVEGKLAAAIEQCEGSDGPKAERERLKSMSVQNVKTPKTLKKRA